MSGYGRRLEMLRGKRTQAEVAKAVGISTSALTMYETERRIPRDDVKIRLADYFETTVQNIFFPQYATN